MNNGTGDDRLPHDAWSKKGQPEGTLASVFIDRCHRQPDRVAYAFVRDTLEVSESVTYGDLYQQVCAISAMLLRSSEFGDRVLLVYPQGIDFVRAFWACCLTGRIAVPVPAPDAARFKNSATRLHAIISDANARLVLTCDDLLQAARQLQKDGDVKSLEVVTTTGAPCFAGTGAEFGLHADLHKVQPDTVAYLQYTSGSTTTPRGVILSHANVIAQCHGTTQVAATTKDSKVLSWLPHHHDYGLVVGIIAPLYASARANLMSPMTFLRRPLRWLDAIERFGITHSGGPNFAYAACVRALGQTAKWKGNLATLQSASCGAEPIRIETMEAFISAFSPHGLSAQALMPSYGMAETVLAISTAPMSAQISAEPLSAEALMRHEVRKLPRGAEGARSIVGCGFPIEGMTVAIVDPASRQPVEGDSVGEIWVSGTSVGQGYWNQPEATEASFRARLASGEGSWLRTGDLGFVANREVFVTGRLKDMIVVRGRNFYPQDLEWSAQNVDRGLRAGYGAAFSVETTDGEQAVVVHEVDRIDTEHDLRRTSTAIREAVADEYELPLHSVVLVRSGTLPRTSSGKIRRQSCKRAFLDGLLDVLFSDDIHARHSGELDAPVSATEIALAGIWQQVLNLDQVGRGDHFLHLGGDSLKATLVASRVGEQMEVDLPLSALFEEPTLGALAARIDHLKATHTRLSETGRIRRVPRETPLPVSFSQRRMWLVQMMNPATTAYNMPFAVRVSGPVSAPQLEQALNAVASRHEAFRTRFLLEGGEPMQVIEHHRPFGLEVLDLAHWPDAEREQIAQAALRERTQRPFGLSAAGLHRPTLVRLGENDHILLWVIHHAIGDLWSGALLLDELSRTYDAIRVGRAPELDAPRLDCSDYAVWQRQGARQHLLQRQMDYWREHLAGISSLNLPVDKQRRGLPSGKGGCITLKLPEATIDSLKLFSATRDITPFMTLLGCFQVLLGAYCAQTDIAVGTPIANRHLLDTERMVGTFVNTLVMRTDLSGDPLFSELLERVRKQALDAYANQDVSFEQLVETLAVGRDLSVSPLVQAMFNVLNVPFDTLTLAGKRVAPFFFDRGSAQFDLSLTVDLDLFGQIQLEYASDLFEASTARRLLENYAGLLGQVLENPGQPLSAYTIPSARSLAEICAWNGTSRTWAKPASATIVEMLTAASSTNPGGCAILTDTQQVSYLDLESRTNQLALALRARGIGRGALVGLCVERGVQMVIAQIAILKSGAAYVPLDPAYPVDRLAHMARDSRMALLVTESRLVASLDWPADKSLLLDAHADYINSMPGAALLESRAMDARAEDAAYVIYTSGSTGMPKGVVVPHRAVVNFLSSMAVKPGLVPSDRLAAVTTLSFDIAVLELLLPLTVGATLVVADSNQVLNGAALRSLVEGIGATVMQATPSTWRMLIEAGWKGSSRFKALIGGEALPQDLAAQLLSRTGELWNMYGPTETTVWSTCWRMHKPSDEISIGHPIDNTSIHILDERLRTCPIGVPGEMFIGGDGVTIGYLNQPELTAARFISAPSAPEVRLYRTGDRGRWRHDGSLEHLGRLDFQVKVRGYRIELGEIEANLATHAAVAHSLVVVREDRPGDPRIVAYLIARGEMPSAHALREHLRASLPEYMVPQHFVRLEGIPLLPNGKTDRSALPAPPETHSATSSEQELPGTRAEVGIAEVWKELLHLEKVYLSDNFFELGGHSLLAIQAVDLVEQRLGRTISIRRLLFETLRQISADLDDVSTLPPAPSTIELRRTADT